MPSPIISQELSAPFGELNGVGIINKFGRSSNVDQTPTDIWDRADTASNQAIWVAPTAARVHNIASTSIADTAAAGAGARTIVVRGLVNWTTPEVSEEVSLSGTTPVATVNSWVIIHRITVLTWGATGPNVGTITATAAVDATVTAQVEAGNGTTLMSIYGVPDGQTIHISSYYASILRANLSTSEVHADLSVLAWLDPPVNPEAYLLARTIGFGSRGSNPFSQVENPYFSCPGPCVVKTQAIGSVANLDISAGFSGYIDKTV
jgi:hypothetical protein